MYFPIEKPLQNLFNSLFHTRNVLSLLNCDCSAPFHVKKNNFSLYRKQFLTTFQKIVENLLWKQKIQFKTKQIYFRKTANSANWNNWLSCTFGALTNFPKSFQQTKNKPILLQRNKFILGKLSTQLTEIIDWVVPLVP